MTTLSDRLRAVNADTATVAAIVEWLRKDLGTEAIGMMLAAGMPSQTRTQRTKDMAFADGFGRCVALAASAIEAAAREVGNG